LSYLGRPLGIKPEKIVEGGAVSFGGTLAAPPRPTERFFPLRRDQFRTLRGGEVSEAHLIRDACLGILATGAVGIAGLYFTIDWDSATSHGRKAPFVVTTLFCILTLTALVVAFVEHRRMKETRTKSSYSRLIRTIADYFDISVPP